MVRQLVLVNVIAIASMSTTEVNPITEEPVVEFVELKTMDDRDPNNLHPHLQVRTGTVVVQEKRTRVCCSGKIKTGLIQNAC